jgi:hypothetical protein
MNKVTAVFSLPDVLRQGKLVANPESWKHGQISVSVLVGFLATLISLGKVFGYDFPVTDEQLLTICSGVMAVFGLFYNPLTTVASTDKIGLPASSKR